jgi:replicative DNA helicase
MLTNPVTFHEIPCAIETEEAVLGALLLDPGAIALVRDILPLEAFYVTYHRTIYAACLQLDKEEQEVNLMTVSVWLSDHKKLERVGGMPKLAQLVDRTVSSVNIDRYAIILNDKLLRRQIIEIGHDLVTKGSDTLVNLPLILSSIEAKTQALIHSPYRSDKPQEQDFLKYKKLVEQIREIELKISDPGFKCYMLHKLAKKNEVNVKQLEQIYCKSLLVDYIEQPMTLEELTAKYGSDVMGWFIHGLIPKSSVMLLHALGGVGKTRFLYHLVRHLTTGSPWGQFYPTGETRNILIVQTDEPPVNTLDTFRDLNLDGTMPIKIMTRWTTDRVAALRIAIENHKADFVIIDSLSSVSRNSIYSENDTEYARPILELRDVAQEFGCTIAVVHHSNSEGKSRGTKAIFNSVSEIWSLSRTSENAAAGELERILTIEKSRSRRPTKYRIKFEPETKGWEFLGEEPFEVPGRFAPLKEKILTLLAENRDKSFSATNCQESLGGNRDSISRCLRELADDGLISRQRIGQKRLYVLNLDTIYSKDGSTPPVVKAEVKASTWRVTKWIPVEDLKWIRDRYPSEQRAGNPA